MFLCLPCTQGGAWVGIGGDLMHLIHVASSRNCVCCYKELVMRIRLCGSYLHLKAIRIWEINIFRGGGGGGASGTGHAGAGGVGTILGQVERLCLLENRACFSTLKFSPPLNTGAMRIIKQAYFPLHVHICWSASRKALSDGSEKKCARLLGETQQ